MKIKELESIEIKKLMQDIEKGNSNAVNEFWTRIEKQGAPLIEEIRGDEDNVLVTFIYKGEAVDNVMIYGGVPGFHYSENIMDHIENTNIYFKTYKVRNDVKFKYNFSLNYEFDNDYGKIKKNSIIDPLNPNKYSFPRDEENPEDEEQIYSLLELCKVKKDFWTVPRENINCGYISLHRFQSDVLGDNRRVWVYTPFGYSEDYEDYRLLLLTDGFEYINISAATVLDNLIRDGKIPSTVCVFIESTKNRYEELTCNEVFSDFIVKELIPWIYKNYNVTRNPQETIMGGVSLGGLAATHIAYKNSNIFGNVLSQSGSYWYEEQWLTKEYENSERLPIKFYLNAGLLEDRPYDTEPIMMEVINNMRDVLLSKGYKVFYENFPSGHDYLCWGETLGTGLIALIGK